MSIVDLSHDFRFGGPRYVHIRGFYGDDGENEGVLSVTSRRDMGPDDPAHLAITIGSPQSSPLVEGYLPNLGGFSCSIGNARVLVYELREAIAIVEGAKPINQTGIRVDQRTWRERVLVHVGGFYLGDTDGVLAITANRDMTPNDPDHVAIMVGSPTRSPLFRAGMTVPYLGGFCCGVEAAKLLIQEINAGIEVAQGKR